MLASSQISRVIELTIADQRPVFPGIGSTAQRAHADRMRKTITKNTELPPAFVQGKRTWSCGAQFRHCGSMASSMRRYAGQSAEPRPES